jgi:NAD(P)-dependent dehydrogenase (short-subunit alcohol dehydrogenase family)
MSKTLIIGATSGIGLATAMLASARGDEVIGIGRDVSKCAQTRELGIRFIASDISSSAQRKNIAEQLAGERIEKVVHCAGIFKTGHPTKEYEELYERVKLGGFELVQSLMLSHPISRVCTITSLYTFIDRPWVPSFEKSVNERLESLALSLPKSVVSNCVAPGLVRTPLTERAFGTEGMARILSYAPGSRILEPEEVAEAVYEIINQTETSGKVIPVDGEFLFCLK